MISFISYCPNTITVLWYAYSMYGLKSVQCSEDVDHRAMEGFNVRETKGDISRGMDNFVLMMLIK